MAKYRRGQKRRRSSFPKFIFFAIFAFILINAFESKNTSQPSQSSGSRTTTPAVASGQSIDDDDSTGASYALQPLTNSWPNADKVDNVLGQPKQYLTNNYYVVLDASGSMRKTECTDGSSKMKVAIDALQEFANSLPNESNFGLALFRDGEIEELVSLGQGNRNQVAQLLQGLQPLGATPLRSSLDFAYKKVTDQAQRQLGYGEYHIVMLTDGKASEGQNPRSVVNAILEESPVNLQTIGFCIGLNHILNQPGRSQYKAADNVEQLRSGLQDVLAESPDFDVSSF